MQPSNDRRNKQRTLAKNVLILYTRLGVVLFISLYTSRVVLQALGAVDFGVYHTLVSAIGLMAFLQGSFSSATERFLAYELGKKLAKNVSRVFSISLHYHFVLALIVITLGLWLGPWLVENRLKIPSTSLSSATLALHLILFSYAASIFLTPYQALVLAHERMGVFSAISMMEVLLKLGVALLLQKAEASKLVLYATLNLVISTIVLILYVIYCRSRFHSECAITIRVKWRRYASFASFAGWSLFGNTARALTVHGTGLLLNIFFGPVMTAARTIASQVSSSLASLSQGLQGAMTPQIVKSHASKDNAYVFYLVHYGSKYNFLMILFISLPFLSYTERILSLWLVNVPEYAAAFTRLAIINVLIDSLSRPVIQAVLARGKIRAFQTVIGGVLLCNIPFAYIALQIARAPELVFYVSIIISLLAFGLRLLFAVRLINFPITYYATKVLTRIVLVSTAAFGLSAMAARVDVDNVFRLLAATFVIYGFVALAILTLGMTRPERARIFQLTSEMLRRLRCT